MPFVTEEGPPRKRKQLHYNSRKRPRSDSAQRSHRQKRNLFCLKRNNEEEPVIRVHLDGKQIFDTVKKYRRRDARAHG